VEEEGGDGGGDGEVSPARAVKECGGHDRARGDAVEEDCDSEPGKRHYLFMRLERASHKRIS
jgi:hypothetical protein